MSIRLTEAAAKQILASAEQGGMQNMPLRIAAKRRQNGSIEYAMGYDEASDTDSRITLHGVEIVVAPTSTDLLDTAVLDYVEMDEGEKQFIFLNPNDPDFVPPEKP